MVVRSARKREPEQSLEALNYLLSVETEEEVIEEAQKAIHLLTSKKEAAQRVTSFLLNMIAI